MNIMQRIIGALALLSCASVWAQADRQYIIHGDASAVAKQGGEAVLWRSGKDKMGGEEVARVPLRQGKFDLRGVVDAVSMAIVAIENGDDTLSQTDIVFEPGEVTITYNAKKAPTVMGAHYYRQTVDPWLTDPRYVDLGKKTEALDAHWNDKLPKAEQERIFTQANSISRRQEKIKTTILRAIYDGSNDPLVRFLTLQQGAIAGPVEARIGALTALQAQLPANPAVPLMIEKIQAHEKSTATSGAIKVGSTIKDFAAPDGGGQNVRLSDVFKQEKYVLVEFWASWCGPCRAQIPSLKKVYGRFHGKGFQIVAYSLDTKKATWQKASEQENLPWLNISDLDAYDSPVVKMFGVVGIPMNYLIDSHGTIVAVNIWADVLENKLKTLL